MSAQIRTNGDVWKNRNNSPENSVWCYNHKGESYTWEEFRQTAEAFHGYGAPGLLLGGVMVSMAMKELPEGTLFDAVCETSTCLPDAIQLLSLCSTGNGWMKVYDYGRFAVTLYDKYTGSGVRVFLVPRELDRFPEMKNWFFRLTPKSEQDTDLLMKNIREAHESILGTQKVAIPVEENKKHKKSPQITICPQCSEASPADGDVLCRACSNGTYYEPV